MGDLLDSMLDPNFEASSVPNDLLTGSMLGQAQNTQPTPTPVAIAQHVTPVVARPGLQPVSIAQQPKQPLTQAQLLNAQNQATHLKQIMTYLKNCKCPSRSSQDRA
jgi:hypothetical protein